MHSWWKHKMVQQIWNIIWQFLKKFIIHLTYNLAILLLPIKNENLHPYKILYTNIHSSIIYNNERMETPHRAISLQMGTQNVIHSNEILFSHKKRQGTDVMLQHR